MQRAPRVRLLFALCIFAVLGAAAIEEEDASEGELVTDDDGLPEQRLSLLSMGIGAASGANAMINVGLDWKYNSATAEDKITTPKLRVGHTKALDAVVHVEAKAAKKVALFTGSDDVNVAVTSRNKKAILGLSSGKGRWDVSVPDAKTLLMGVAGAQPTVRLADGKMGIGTKEAPTSSLQIQSNTKGDSLRFQGNFDNKLDSLVDASITLESSADGRGRGMFMPHRGKSSAATAWFSGVPAGGGGFQIGSSSSHMPESPGGAFTKKKAHLFVTTDGKVGIGHTAPQGQLDIQLLAGNKKNAYRALNVRSGSINVDMGQGLNSNRLPIISGERDFIQVGSTKKSEEREIRLQTGVGKFVTVSRYNAYVGIGVKNPSAALDVKGSAKVSDGQIMHSMAPKLQQQMHVLNSQSSVPASIGFRQQDQPYLTISAGKTGATLELANRASLTVANGKFGIGTDPTQLLHVKGGDALLEGKSTLMFKSKMAGTKIYEEEGLHISGGQAGKIHLEQSDVMVSNKGSGAKIRVMSGPAKESSVELMSGSELWKLHMSMGGSGTLHLSNKGPRMALTTDGKLGVGVKVPMEAIHIQGSGLLESSSKPVFVSVQTKSESQQAGLRLKSASEEWRVMTNGAGSKSAGPGSLQFAHGSATHVVISKTGSLGVGIGAPLPGTSLHVKGPSMYDVGKGKGKIVISTPNGNPGMSFFDNDGFRRMDLEATKNGLSFMSATGFLGVGTKSAKSKLHIYDAKNTKIVLSRSGRMSSEGYLQYNGPYLKLGTSTSDGVQLDVNGAPKVTVHPNGNVGVGTVTPMSQLQVGARAHLYQAGDNAVFSGNSFFDGAKFKYSGTGGAAGVQMQNDGSLGFFTARAGTKDMEVVDFQKPRLSVNSKGNVGVGTSAPDTSLHVAATTKITLKTHGALMVGGAASKENLGFDTKTVQTRNNGQPSMLRVNPFGGDVTFFADTTRQGQSIVFSNSGRIGFGPKAPIAKMHVSEGSGRFATIALGESKAGVAVIRYKSDKMTLGFSKGTAGNKEDAISILKNGSVGVGIAAPKSKLHVKGNVIVTGKLNVGGKQVVSMMEDLAKENERLSMELAATKEMLMSMSANMQKMQATMTEMSTARATAA